MGTAFDAVFEIGQQSLVRQIERVRVFLVVPGDRVQPNRNIWMKKPAWSTLSVKGAVSTIGDPALCSSVSRHFFRPDTQRNFQCGDKVLNLQILLDWPGGEISPLAKRRQQMPVARGVADSSPALSSQRRRCGRGHATKALPEFAGSVSDRGR
jgi:hypothetical protein